MGGHTPGPWAVDANKNVMAAGGLVAFPGISAGFDQEANARLIATAPEMLGLLREVSGFLHGISVGAYSRNNMEQLAHELSSKGFVLIAKATNQQGNNHD